MSNKEESKSMKCCVSQHMREYVKNSFFFFLFLKQNIAFICFVSSELNWCGDKIIIYTFILICAFADDIIYENTKCNFNFNSVLFLFFISFAFIAVRTLDYNKTNSTSTSWIENRSEDLNNKKTKKKTTRQTMELNYVTVQFILSSIQWHLYIRMVFDWCVSATKLKTTKKKG